MTVTNKEWNRLHNKAYGYNKDDCLICQKGDRAIYIMKMANGDTIAVHEDDLQPNR